MNENKERDTQISQKVNYYIYIYYEDKVYNLQSIQAFHTNNTITTNDLFFCDRRRSDVL